MKIEDKPVGRLNENHEFHEFLRAIRDLEVGQSFYLDDISTSCRIVLSSTMILLGKKFATQKEGNGYRVGRVS